MGDAACTHLPIEIKTTGQLIDELTIAEQKQAAGDPYICRNAWALREAVAVRIRGLSVENLVHLDNDMRELRAVNKTIWDLIDLVMNGQVLDHAQRVQQENAKRREIVRRIDARLGQRDIDGKVYA